MVTPEGTAAVIVNDYRQCDLRMVTLVDLPTVEVGIGISKLHDPVLVTEINRAIIALRGLITGITVWYGQHRRPSLSASEYPLVILRMSGTCFIKIYILRGYFPE